VATQAASTLLLPSLRQTPFFPASHLHTTPRRRGAQPTIPSLRPSNHPTIHCSSITATPPSLHFPAFLFIPFCPSFATCARELCRTLCLAYPIRARQSYYYVPTARASLNPKPRATLTGSTFVARSNLSVSVHRIANFYHFISPCRSLCSKVRASEVSTNSLSSTGSPSAFGARAIRNVRHGTANLPAAA